VTDEAHSQEWLSHMEYPGGLRCVASKGFTEERFRMCGNRCTYGKNFGSVANEGVRGNWFRRIVRRGGREIRGVAARVTADYQSVC